MRFIGNLPKDKLQKVALVALVTLIGFVGVGRLYAWRQYANLKSNKAEIAKLKQQIQQAERDAQRATENQEERQQLTAFVQQQEATMVAGDPFAWVVREISLLGEKHPVRIASMRPLGTTTHPRKSRYEVFTVALELTGTYNEIGAFVRDLENKFPAAEVRSLEVVGSETASLERRANLNLALLVRPQSVQKQEQGKTT